MSGALIAFGSPNVWVAGSLVKILPTSPTGNQTSITLYAARAEYQSFQIGVQAPIGGLSNVNVVASSLNGIGGAVIAASNLTLFRENYVTIASGQTSPQSGGAGPCSNCPLGAGTYPDGLIPFTDPDTGLPLPPGAALQAAPFSVTAAHNQVIWVDVYVPPGATAGQYNGTLTITSDQGQSQVSVVLNVWNFSLPTQPSLKSAFLVNDTAHQLSTDKELLRNRLMTDMTTGVPEMAALQPNGLSSTDLGYYSGASYGNCVTSEAAPTVSAAQSGAQPYQQMGLLVFDYSFDEIDACTKLFPTVIQWAQNLHAAGVSQLITMAPNPALYSDGTGTGRSAVDIWVMLPDSYNTAQAQSPKRVSTVLAKGDQAWSYQTLVQDAYSPKWLIDFNAIGMRLQAGFISQSLSLSGLLYWQVDGWESGTGASSWSNVEFAGSYPGEGILVYPGEAVGLTNKVAPSMRLKYLRDGVDDYEYVQILKNMGMGSWALQMAATVAPDWTNWSRDPSAVDAVRIALGQQINSLVCPISLSSGGQSLTASGASGIITVTAPQGCPWSVSGLPSWVAITSPSVGIGSGSVSFQVLSNGGADLSGSFTIGSATFTIEQEGGSTPGLSLLGSMPHLAAEGGWNTTFTFVNKGATSAIARTTLFAPNGLALTLPLDLPQQPAITGSLLATSLDQTIAPNALFVMEAAGPANVSYLEGSAQLAASGTVDGFAIFHFDPSQQEAVVPMETRIASSYLLAFDNTNGVLTGVAIENVSASSANIPVIIRDDTGIQVGTGTVSLAASGHTSFVLSTQYPTTANIRGTIEFDAPSTGFTTNGQISVLGIRYTPPGTLTTIPALANVGTTGGLMAHLASANGWQTTFVLVNTGSSSAQAQLNFFDNNGNPLQLPLTVLEGGATSTASSVTQNIAANASLWVQSTGSLTSALLTGSAQLTTTGKVSGFVIFRYNPNGQEAVVPLESRNAGSYLLAFDNTNGTATGVAINAVSSQQVAVPIVIRNDTGAQIGTGTIPLSANGHASFVLGSQYPITSGIRGTVEFGTPSGAEISVLGIRSPPALTFTTLPPLAN